MKWYISPEYLILILHVFVIQETIGLDSHKHPECRLSYTFKPQIVTPVDWATRLVKLQIKTLYLFTSLLPILKRLELITLHTQFRLDAIVSLENEPVGTIIASMTKHHDAIVLSLFDLAGRSIVTLAPCYRLELFNLFMTVGCPASSNEWGFFQEFVAFHYIDLV